jgi:hypothetical protein
MNNKDSITVLGYITWYGIVLPYMEINNVYYVGLC